MEMARTQKDMKRLDEDLFTEDDDAQMESRI